LTETAYQRHFEDVLGRIRQPARLIGGEFGAGAGFSEDPGELRVVLGFPDTYEIGISNQAIQILHHLAREMQGVAVERTYLPWVDAIAALRERGLPLLTMETWSPVVSADVLGLTIQHEFNYTNLLEMLDLAGIPLHWEDRMDGHPLVLAGGPACANFLPLSRFLDAVVVGDGEEVFPEILRLLAACRREGASRTETRSRLTGVDGVFVPGLSRRVVRRAILRLEGAPYPKECLVPLTAGVHDRAWVEIMRGCTRGCRFCQAGMWYRPVRERSMAEVLRMAAEQLSNSGHQELALASLSTTDYSCIEPLLQSTAATHPEVRISLPSLRVDSAAVRLAALASPTGPSLTFAPEAGSQRMRDIINKNVTEDDIFSAAEEAFRAGRTTLKLYFMIGLPFEEDADIIAIADLCLRLRDLGRGILGARANRLQLNISVNNFVPKPFTPFQWAGMAARETLLRRQGLLRSRLRKPGVRAVFHEVPKSYLEAALARGGEELGAVIEGAWRRGARLDSWTEQFRADAWDSAFEEAGTSAERLATTVIERETALPWDVIAGVVEKNFLWEEWETAKRRELTPDCRWDRCSSCGACDAPPQYDLAAGSFGHAAADSTLGPNGDPGHLWGSGDIDSHAEPRRYVATFSVTGRGRYLGHLDRAEVFRRAVRRAGGRLAQSGGMRPKPLLSLALPLAVGMEGRRELCEFRLSEDPGPDFAARLATSLPDHMLLVAVEPYDGTRSVPARVTAASYEVEVAEAAGLPAASATQEGTRDDMGRARGDDLCAALDAAADRFARSQEVLVEETREGRARLVDVKRYVDAVAVRRADGGWCTLAFRARVSPAGAVRPERVVEALAQLVGIELEVGRIERIEVHLS